MSKITLAARYSLEILKEGDFGWWHLNVTKLAKAKMSYFENRTHAMHFEDFLTRIFAQ